MTNNPFRLDGQLALVTGGSSGLGLATCQALINAGATVVLTGRREDALEKASAELGPAAHTALHDVANLASTPALVANVEARHGPIDILINNAGNHIKKPAVDTTDAEFMQVLQPHLLGAFALSRECGRRMITRQQGSIVMILSMTALFGIPQVPAYTAAKSAMLGLTRALATEFSPHGVRVNGIAPGWIETRMSLGAFQNDPARLQKVLGRTPLNRLGQPLDVGLAAVYLCSPAASFVTGAVLPVDGGASIGF